MKLTQMQDIGGCRAVVKSIGNIRTLVESYKRSTFSHVLKGERDYISSPKPDGYRSYHLMYQYNSRSEKNSSYDNLRIEVQIRTRLQHAWATAVEAVGVFTKQALKANVGDPDWLRLFSLMSAEVALLEKTPVGAGVPLPDGLRRDEIQTLSKRLNVNSRAIVTP